MTNRSNTASLALILVSLACAACSGHVIHFDFQNPGCKASHRPSEEPGDILVRYLGAGGLYLKWQGTSLLTGPFFSNPGRFRAVFGKLAANGDRIKEGLREIGPEDLQNVRAILLGHSHYDHLADVPYIAENDCPKARIYVNKTGANMLAGLLPLKERVTSIEDLNKKDWTYLRGDDGSRLPIRFRAVETEHAPLYRHINWSRGEVEHPWDKGWDGHRFRQLRAGKPFAFVIDLLSPENLDQVRFRIYYQDAASGENQGYPPVLTDGKGYDLAVLCMASFRYVKNAPGGILGNLHPRHVLVTHYEDFFRDPQKPLRFVPLLTNHLADEFLGRVRTSLAGIETLQPAGPVCGPSSPAATMPLLGEWLRFHPREAQP